MWWFSHKLWQNNTPVYTRNICKCKLFKNRCIQRYSLTNPDYSSCTRGITVLFVFKNMFVANSTAVSQEHILLDTLGKNVNGLGYRISLSNYQVQVFVRSRTRSYKVKVSFNRNAFNHLAFTWSRYDGLKLYLNSLLRYWIWFTFYF